MAAAAALTLLLLLTILLLSSHAPAFQLEIILAPLLAGNLTPSHHPSISLAALRPPINVVASKYAVMVSIGTPPVRHHLLLHTSRDLTWIQCAGCNPKFPQGSASLFDPNQSTTASAVPCSSPLRMNHPCIGGRCYYEEPYGGEAEIRGFLMQDKLWMGNESAPAPVAFGCNSESYRLEHRFRGGLEGVLGLSRGTRSLVSQLGPLIQRRFSYCLHSGPTSFLSFGSHAVMTEQAPVTVPLKAGHLYVLEVTGMSFNGQRLGFAGDAPERPLRMSVDTGSEFSILDAREFNLLGTAVDSYMLQRRYNRAKLPTDSVPYFQRCWKMGRAELPGMRLHLEGGDMEVSGRNLFYFTSEPAEMACLAVVSRAPGRGGLAVLGTRQQRDTRFVFDLEQGKLQFASADCGQNP